MLRRAQLVSLALCALALVACDDGEGGPSPDASPRDADVTLDGATLDVGPDEGPGPDEGLDPDGGPDPDVGPDPDMAPRPDRGMPRVIESCEDGCGRIAACDRLELYGDYDGCLDACTRSSRGGPPEGWFTCLELEDNCGLVQLCRLPEPPALDCDTVCAGLDECGVELPFPDCVAECTAQNALDGDAATPRFSACGEAVVMACDPDGFWDCAADTIYTACDQRCTNTVACNLERADGCLQACIAERYDEDPLARRRAEQRVQCTRFAGGDCVRLDACLNPQAAPVFDERLFCQRWDGCFGDFGFPCEEAFFWEEESPGFLACADAQLRQGCAGDPFIVIENCFNGGGQLGPGCVELCEAREICGDLGAGEDRQSCLARCSDAIARGGEGAQRQRALFPCGIAQTCDELAVCLGDNSPVAACEAHCEALAGCGLGDAGCQATCDAEFFRERRIGYRDCVSAAAGDCAAIGACDLGEPIGCDLLCARLDVCGAAGANCEANCDDESYTAPRVAEARLACALEAPLCFRGVDSIDRCANNERSAGTACLGWCRAQTGCDPDDVAGLTDCLVACGEGLRGEDGERFAAARDCLEGVDVRGACAAIERCIPADPLDCPAWCGPLDACDAAPADCAAACQDDALARLRQAEQRGCLADARGACDAVLACVEPDGGQAVFDPARFCGDFNACGLQDLFGDCQFFIEEFAREPAVLECAQRFLDPCPADPFLIIDACFQGGEGGAGPIAPCRALCQARARCGELDGPLRDCAAACVDEVEARPDELEAALLPCGRALTCGDYEACRAANDPANACDDHCAALDACGVMPDGCGADCAAGFFRDRQRGWRQCVVAAAGDCDAVAACAPAEPYGCEARCARLDACNLAGRDCLADCDDAHYQNPPAARRELACIVSAPLCSQGGDSVANCRNRPAVAGGACLAWCRAESGCDPSADEAIAACVVACGEGFVGDDGLRFAAARDCLDGVDAQGACGPIDACIPAEPDVDCPGWCAPLAVCDLAPGDCDATCPEDPLARLRAATQPACLDDAGADCDAVAACLGDPVDDGPVLDVVALCRSYDRCGIEDFFGLPCEEVIREFGFDEGVLLCFQENLVVCPVDPFELFNLCLEQGGDNEIPNLAACQSLCVAQGRCGALDGSIRDCASRCVDAMRQRPDGPQADVLPCRRALDCDGLDTCLTANGPAGQCADVCDAATACGAFPDAAACLDRCGAQLFEPVTPPSYLDDVAACLDGLDGAACAAEGATCFEVEVGDCAAVCQAAIDCGLNDDGGFEECLFGCQEDPAAAVIIACIQRHLIEGMCDVDSLIRCVEDAGVPF